MTIPKPSKYPILAATSCGKFLALASALVLCCLPVRSRGQGTVTVRFNSQPRGTRLQTGQYNEGSLQFRAVPFGVLYLSGGGFTGFPDNGTGYLETAGNADPHGGLTFSPTYAFSTFSLIAFDAAEYWDLGSTVLTVIGYKPLVGTVTNIFTTDGINDGTGPLQDFQTFYLDATFVNLSRVDMYASSYGGVFSLDNLVISGVPEPSAGALIFLGMLCAMGRPWTRNYKR